MVAGNSIRKKPVVPRRNARDAACGDRLGFFARGAFMTAHLLVVDDNEVERLGMAALLAREGFEVTVAANGEEAINLLHTFIPDTIVLDMLMPDLDGWEFLRVRNYTPLLKNVPVIIVTGGGFASDEWARELGAEGFLKKPVNTDLLTETVKKLTQAEN